MARVLHSEQDAGVTCVLYAGSFDPLHLGHLSVIERAASMFDSVVVAVLGNPIKRSHLFSADQRVRLVTASVDHLPNVSCTRHHGLTIDAAKHAGADGIIRTGHKDRDDEWSMLAMNELVSGIKTFFVPPDPAVAHLSSSRVRSLLADGEQTHASSLVPVAVSAAFVEREKRRPARSGIARRPRS